MSHPIPCTLMIYWGETSEEPWYLLTDSPSLPSLAGSLYAERMWIEHQFKTIKSNGWHAEKSRIVDPDRVARMWLAYAVGMLWALSVGSHPLIGYDDKEDRHEACSDFEQEVNSEDEISASAKPDISPASSIDKPRDMPRLRLDSQATIVCAQSVKRTVSWFAKGLAVLADRINRAVQLECPRFYCPVRSPQLRKC